MTTSPPDAEAPAEEEQEEAPDPLAEYAERVAEATSGEVAPAVQTVKIRVPAERWVEALTIARDELGLVFFSWLSAIDWTNEVEVGDPPDEEVDDRIEVLATVSDLSDGHRVTFATDLDHDRPQIDSLIEVYAGADWHEREAYEMFGIDFVGHPNLIHLYLPDAFEGHPLRKSYPLLSREVKPWPGKVDVEDMPEPEEEESEDESGTDEEPADPDAPSTENPGR